MTGVVTKQRLLVIGGVAAGTKAAARAKRLEPELDVTLVTLDSDISYAGCGLPYFLSGVIKERRELVVKTPEEYAADTGVRVLVRHEAMSIDPKSRLVRVRDLETGVDEEFAYDRLILATGASPVRLPIPGIELGHVYNLRTVRDAVQIREFLQSGRVRRAVVIGGGFIGLEAAENLHLAGVECTVVEATGQILPGFEPELALLAANHLAEKGLAVRCGERVQTIAGNEAGDAIGVTTDQGEYPADMVICATGVRPNVELARDCGIEIGPTRAIRVNGHMQTSVPEIYAVGDCAETTGRINRTPAWSPMGSTANKAGRTTGSEAAGHSAAGTFAGVLGTTVVKLFDWHMAKTGLTAAEAERCGHKTISALVPANDRAHYYPGYHQIITKLVVDAETRRVLGAQVAGEGVVDKPIDTLVTLITLGGTVDDLASLDLAYAPPFATAIASSIVAAHVIQNKLDGLVDGVNPTEIPALLENDGVQVVDIRTEPEHIIAAIPGAINIPFSELEARSSELSRDRRVVLVCKVGKRAYLASRLLKRLGFKNVSILDGGMACYPYEVV